MSELTLRSKILSGVFWNTVQVVIYRSFSFVIKLVLARLLFPEQFGLVGMASVFISFIEVFNDIGIAAALVQRKEEDLREAHFHTSFWSGVVWSISLYIFIALVVAPLAAIFYEEPLLRSIIPVLSIGVLSSPVNLVHKAQLTKAMDFKKQAFIENAAHIFSGVLSLMLAFAGAGVWALVFNAVASFLVAMPLYFRATSWTPKLIWEREAFSDIFGFGLYTTATNFFNNLINKLDYLLIGKLVSASALGAYTLAFILTDIVKNELMNIMNKVMYPVYGTVQDDLKSLKSYYVTIVKYNSLVVYPIMLLWIIEGEPILLTVFGAKWTEAVIPLKLLAGSVLFHMMVNSNTTLVRGMGKARLEMKLQFWKALLMYAPLLSAGIYFYGINGAAMAFLVIKFLSVFIVQVYMKILIDYTFADLFRAMKVPVVASAIASLVVLGLHAVANVHFIISSGILLMIYTLIVYKMMGQDIAVFVKSLKKEKKLKT
ncbi:lipopolysaccharide biosynthesis protein [Tunicatimonas pelagia]|uniref:lipopolysaccharide biosynthesis protein n=1 Tax=Tunicatimonas pelagia TaxID=931531 RepID=UPI002666C8AF|nr:lipopolysaccharide biosynthesis protein [Tunicatimonas pelagia]WKN40434.1 lipopolysaccharide biosynthesis protein [Tunicatimonas pelagia]